MGLDVAERAGIVDARMAPGVGVPGEPGEAAHSLEEGAREVEAAGRETREHRIASVRVEGGEGAELRDQRPDAELEGQQGLLDQAREGLVGEPPAGLERLHRRSARRLRVLCEELRGGVLKLGQFASTRMDLLPDAYVEELSKLQDRVPPVATAEVTARMDRELGPDWRHRFGSFECAPLAAASLAQVHGATLTDGTPVAVKLLVPGIEDVVEADLAAMRILVPTLADLLPRVDLTTLLAALHPSRARPRSRG